MSGTVWVAISAIKFVATAIQMCEPKDIVQYLTDLAQNSCSDWEVGGVEGLQIYISFDETRSIKK